MENPKSSITDVPGIKVGHAHNLEALTGCTVVLCEAGAVGGVDQRGGAPGTRETDLLRPLHLVERVHAVLLAGGSAYGLDAAGGVMRYLEERRVGFRVGAVCVPIVPAAILYDLGLGRADVRPDAAMGYAACQNASAAPPAEGNVGAGAGATVGKVLGMAQATKAGIGAASVRLWDEVVIGAIVAVNAFGDIIIQTTSSILAGARTLPDTPGAQATGHFADTLQVMQTRAFNPTENMAQNTVIGVVATNASLTKEQANKVAQMAQDGLARAIRPAHTPFDGDTIFALATGEVGRQVDANGVTIIGALAAEVFYAAILRGVRAARPAGGLPSAAS